MTVRSSHQKTRPAKTDSDKTNMVKNGSAKTGMAKLRHSHSRKPAWTALMVGVSHIAGLAAGLSGGLGMVGTAHAQDSNHFAQASNLALAAKAAPKMAAMGKAGPNAANNGQIQATKISTAANGLDGIAVKTISQNLPPVLSVGLIDAHTHVTQGKPARFLGFSNYPGFIKRAELRIFPSRHPMSRKSVTPHIIVPADENGLMEWTPGRNTSAAMQYVYRVYDGQGSYDETAPQNLTILPASENAGKQTISRPEFGTVDSAKIRNILLQEAVPVEVTGTALPGYLVRVGGQITPTDNDGCFANQQLIPGGQNIMPISAVGPDGSLSEISCMVNGPIRGVTSNAHLAGNDNRAGDGLSIVVGQREQGDNPAPELQDQDQNSNPYDIEIRSDATHINPVLAVGLRDTERTALRGEDTVFLSYSNYNAFIARRELRIFAADTAPDKAPLAIVASDENGIAAWRVPAQAPKELYYTLRVYDNAGNFDETTPQELIVLEERLQQEAPPLRPLFGSRDQAAKRNIRMHKSMNITVTGKTKSDAEIVRIGGYIVPVTQDGEFVSEQIVPRDIGMVRINIGQNSDAYYTALRDVEAKGSDWFIVGQGDLTFVSSKGAGPAVEVSGNRLMDGDYITSRAAFYAKGSLASGVKITSSLDTGETLLKDIFSNLDRKDPRQLLRRLGSNQYYTTYGDDSTLVQDAPTQGRFYLKVENLKVDKGRAGLLIGNYVADIEQAELAQINRGVFGAIAEYKSVKTTSFGEADQQITIFAADPGTIPGRDEFRGTGGSLYFLKRRDLAVGSERLSVEIRDRDTGIVLSQRDLRPQEDYDIDYFQGRVSLLKALSSYAADGDLVRNNASGGNIPVLVARYEYTPAVGDLTGYTIGGRASTWLKDTVRLGFTAQRETTDSADQTLVGGDITIRAANGSYVKAEVAQSQGPGFGQANSVDGGLTFTDVAAPGTIETKALAWRTEVAVDLADLQSKDANGGGNVNSGKISAFYENFEAGFSSNGRLTANDTQRWGAAIDAPITQATQIQAKIEQLNTAAFGKTTTASAQITQKFGQDVSLSAQVRHNMQSLANSTLGVSATGAGTGTGKRTDGAIQIDYAPAGKNWSLLAFGQATLDKDAARQSNNRGGIGGKATISDSLSASGEISHGTGGLGASLELTHRYSDGSENYLGYSLLADRTDLGLAPMVGLTQTNNSTLTFGTRHRFSSALSVKAENRIGYGGQAPSLTRSFGMDWTPNEKWSFSGSYENGYIDNPATGRFRRNAITFGAGISTDQIKIASNIEGRFEKGQGRDQEVWLFRNTMSLKLHPDWRSLGRFNFAIANNNVSTGGPNAAPVDVRAADFVEGTIGFAYRPINNDRLNMLAQYTYLRDLGPVGQITAGGETASPKQESQILSIDANFDLTKTVTLGGKYAFRKGSVSLGRDSDDFVSSNTQLAVARVDWRLVKQWDLLVEGHYLSNSLAGDAKWGGLAGIYRHINENVKLGVGYSFSDFSSNLADQSYTSKGYFVNILGKF